MPNVDLVFEGGGVKGAALVGALAALTEAGHVAVRVAGTSAGAVLAALFVAGESPEELRDGLLAFPFTRMRDTGWEDRVPVVGPVLSVLLDQGVYEGAALEAWVRARLAARGVRTFADVDGFEGWCRLQVVVSDVTERRLLMLPRDAHLLGVTPAELDVALMVRASASLPFFFEPVRWRHPVTGREHVLVDGGLLSNFPVWAFDTPLVPRWPTFGLMLVEERPRDPLGQTLPPTGARMNVFEYVRALVSTMLEAHDRRYLETEDFVRTVAIPTLGVRTTHFDLAREEILALFEAGRAATRSFLSGWDFDAYVRAFRVGNVPSRREMVARELRRTRS